MQLTDLLEKYQAESVEDIDRILIQKESQIQLRDQYKSERDAAVLAAEAVDQRLAVRDEEHAKQDAEKDQLLAALSSQLAEEQSAHAATIAERAKLQSVYDEMTAKVREALEDPQPEVMIALGNYFLTDDKEKTKQAILARMAADQAALEALN